MSSFSRAEMFALLRLTDGAQDSEELSRLTKSTHFRNEAAAPPRRVARFLASYTTLGGVGGPPSTKIDETGNLLLSAAKQDFPAVVDGLSAAAIDELAMNGDVQKLLDSEKFWALAAAFADDHRRPAWLNEITTDKDFFERLNGEVKAQDRGATLAGLEGTRRFAARGNAVPRKISASLLLLSGSRPDALKRAQLDHLCTHTLKGP